MTRQNTHVLSCPDFAGAKISIDEQEAGRSEPDQQKIETSGVHQDKIDPICYTRGQNRSNANIYPR